MKSPLAFLQIDLFALDVPEKGFIDEYEAAPAGSCDTNEAALTYRLC